VDLTIETLLGVRTGDRIVENAEGEPLTPLMQAIFDERRREMFLEGDRWFELKRNGSPEWWIINNGLKYTTKKYMYTAPIYKGDVDINPDLKQNELFVNKWHDFVNEVQDKMMQVKDDALFKKVNMFLLQQFFIERYHEDDFYKQFDERLEKAKTVVGMLVQ
jgi:hypothetical protein